MQIFMILHLKNMYPHGDGRVGDGHCLSIHNVSIHPNIPPLGMMFQEILNSVLSV